jgi:hypothetical protein
VLDWLQAWDSPDYAWELTQLWPRMQYHAGQWQTIMGQLQWQALGAGFEEADAAAAAGPGPNLCLDWGPDSVVLAEGAGWDDAARAQVGKNVQAIMRLARALEKIPGLNHRRLGLESGSDLAQRVRDRFLLLQ